MRQDDGVLLPKHHLTFVGVPHPATRNAFVLLRDLLAADGLSCELDTKLSHDSAGDRVYLRADASDAVALIAAGDYAADEDVWACRAVARIAAAAESLPTISIDAVLTDPYRALALLPPPLPSVSADRIAAVLHGRQAALLGAVVLCRHPLAFIRAVEQHDSVEPHDATSNQDEIIRALEAQGFAWGNLDGTIGGGSSAAGQPAVRAPLALIVSGDPDAAVADLVQDGAIPLAAVTLGLAPQAGQGDGNRLLLATAPASGPWPAIPAQFDRVHLHHVADSTDPSALWAYAMAARGPHGIVTGREPNAGVVQQMLAKLMRDRPTSDITFELAGSRWAGVPSSAWQA